MHQWWHFKFVARQKGLIQEIDGLLDRVDTSAALLRLLVSPGRGGGCGHLLLEAFRSLGGAHRGCLRPSGATMEARRKEHECSKKSDFFLLVEGWGGGGNFKPKWWASASLKRDFFSSASRKSTPLSID